MINFDGKNLQEEFNKTFGNLLIPKMKQDKDSSYLSLSDLDNLTFSKLTVQQLWWLVKFAKHVRGRCRNNAAFNNYMNRNFPHAQFSNVLKEYNGRTYQGLKITVNGESLEGEDNE